MKMISVFCGSNVGRGSDYRAATVQLGKALVKTGIGLVYGGGSVGLMNALAEAVAAEGGRVIGVIPQCLVDMEVANTRAGELRIVESMHARKAMMEQLADGFIALPGGFGTLDELCEIITWAQLGFHGKPCGLLNVKGYFNLFLDFLDHAVSERFIRKEHRAMLFQSSDPEELLKLLSTHQAVAVKKWVADSDNF